MLKMKRVLSLALVVVMLLSSSSMVFASEFKDVSGKYETAVDVLTSLGIINGYEDGTYKPEKTITRAELAKLLVETLGYGNLNIGVESSFKDMKGHWADNWVGIAGAIGLVAGYPDGTFKPDATVSYDEAYTMIVRSLGYSDEVVKGMWPLNFKIKALELGLTDNVDAKSEGADRGGVAQVLFNSLEVPLVKVGANKTIVYQYKEDGKTQKTLLDTLCDYDANYVVTPDKLNKDSRNYAGNKVNLENYMYQSLRVYLNDKDEVLYVKGSNSIVVEGDIVAKDTDTITIKDKDGDRIKVAISDDIRVFFNGGESTHFDMNTMLTENEKNPYEKIVIVGKDTNNNGRIDNEEEVQGVILNQQTQATVISETYRTGRTKLDTINLPLDSYGRVDLTKVVVTGAASTIQEIKLGDVVVVYKALSNDFVKLVVTRGKAVEGKINRIDIVDNEVYVNSKPYSVNKNSTTVFNKNTNSLRVTLGYEGKFFLDHDNKIVGYDLKTVERENYAVVVGITEGVIERGIFGDDYRIKSYPYIKLATADNKTEVFELYVEIDEDNASLEDSVMYNTSAHKNEYALLTTTTTAIGFAPIASSELAKGQIIKYNVNKYGQIDGITFVIEENMSALNPNSKGFVLAEGAVIFENDGVKYPIVKKEYLDNSINGKIVYNNDGEIEVLLVNSSDINEVADETLIAYLSNANNIGRGYNSKGKIVQIPVLYVDGEYREFYTESDNLITGGKGLYRIELDANDVILKATKVTPVEATIVSMNSKGTMLRLTVGGNTEWYAVGTEATMLEFEKNGDIHFLDTYDLYEGMTINVVFTEDIITYIGFTVQ